MIRKRRRVESMTQLAIDPKRRHSNSVGTEPNLLVISDLHLGEKVGSGRAPDPRTEQALVQFLRHHAHHPRGGRPWRLVINGDAVDLVGICLMPEEADWLTGLDEDDHQYGLGEHSMASTLKLGKVVEAHEGVFRALAEFVGCGHDIVMVLGNHDAELHWPAAQQLLRDVLRTLWSQSDDSRQTGARSADDVAGAITFHSWFYLEKGVAWIEHGHQYDPYCSFDDVLEPATDEHRIDPNVGGAILRYVANHFTADASEHWGSGFFGYLQWWVGQGLDKALDILGGYRDMVRTLIRHWQERRPERVAARRARSRERLRRLAERLRLPEEKLARLAALREEPVVTDLLRIVRAVMLDRLLLLLATPLLVAVPLMLPWAWMPWSITVPMAIWVVWAAFALVERESTDPRATMRGVAGRIRAAMRVPIVVMGHSHDPCADVRGDGAYFNTGTWVPHGEGMKAFTHLLIERSGSKVRAALCQWREGRSQRFDDDGLGVLLTVPVAPVPPVTPR
jgi:UDP-2,3-diacylglucosamine pyrophosphatase LpxH